MKLGHQEIFEQMRRDILAGRFDGENKLPSEPCVGEYIIGAPQVPAAQVKVGGEGERRMFNVLAKGLSEEDKYVKSVTLNGKPITDWKIRHADIVKGGELVFEMGW